jgi:hypothetical protein
MLQPRDIAVLLAAARGGEGWTMRTVGEMLGLGPAAIHRSLGRLERVGLYSSLRRQANAAVLDEFIRHGLRFVDRRQLGSIDRGYPTAWAAEPLRGDIWGAGSVPPVWPAAEGPVRGATLTPLVPNAHELIERAPELAADLSLVDAICIGTARERARAADLLAQRLIGVPA